MIREIVDPDIKEFFYSINTDLDYVAIDTPECNIVPELPHNCHEISY